MKKVVIIVLSLLYFLFIYKVASVVEAKELPSNQRQMADKIADICIANYDKYGVLPSVCVGQAFIESTLGEHCSNTHNYFGICSGGVSYGSLEEGVIAYLKVINNGCYGTAPFDKNWRSQIRKILAGGYCVPVGTYFNDLEWSVEHYDFEMYDRRLYALQKRKKEKWRKKQWKKGWHFRYDPTVPEYMVAVPKSLIKGGVVIAYMDDRFYFMNDVIAKNSINEKVLRVNIPNIDGKAAKIEVIENAKG